MRLSRERDIHIEPFELETVVRYRADGVMREVFSLTPSLQLPPGLTDQNSVWYAY